MARLVGLWIAVLTLTFFSFSLLQADPARVALGANASAAAVQNVRHEYGLDRSMAVRYLEFVQNACTFDFGRSIVTGRPVSETVGASAIHTLEYVGIALLLSVAISLGVVLTLPRWGRRARASVVVLARIVTSVPVLVVATAMGASLISVGLWRSGDEMARVWLVGGALAVYPVAAMTELLVAGAQAIRKETFITAAVGWGYNPDKIHRSIVVRLLAVSWVGLFSNIAVALLGGSVVAEVVLSMPGFGALLLQSVTRNDAAMMQGIVVMVVGGYVVVTQTSEAIASWTSSDRLAG